MREHWDADLSQVELVYAATEDGTFARLFSERVSRIVWIAGRRPGTGAIESELEALLAHIENHPQHRAVAEHEMGRYAGRLAEDPPDPGLIEMLQFCMATFRWPSVLAVLTEVHAAAQARHVAGQQRAWQVVRNTDAVIAAFSNQWPGGDAFDRYRSDS